MPAEGRPNGHATAPAPGRSERSSPCSTAARHEKRPPVKGRHGRLLLATLCRSASAGGRAGRRPLFRIGRRAAVSAAPICAAREEFEAFRPPLAGASALRRLRPRRLSHADAPYWAIARATNYSERPRSGRSLIGEAIVRAVAAISRPAGWGPTHASTRYGKPGANVESACKPGKIRPPANGSSWRNSGWRQRSCTQATRLECLRWSLLCGHHRSSPMVALWRQAGAQTTRWSTLALVLARVLVVNRAGAAAEVGKRCGCADQDRAKMWPLSVGRSSSS
jgi:hypothetical protein